MKIPSARARKPKTERIDIRKGSHFILPPRDPGRIPSLNRPVTKPKLRSLPDIPKNKEGLSFEQDLAIMNTKDVPVPPLPIKQFPTDKKEEKPSNLSDLI